jgi:hypothetical protein
MNFTEARLVRGKLKPISKLPLFALTLALTGPAAPCFKVHELEGGVKDKVAAFLTAEDIRLDVAKIQLRFYQETNLNSVGGRTCHVACTKSSRAQCSELGRCVCARYLVFQGQAAGSVFLFTHSLILLYSNRPPIATLHVSLHAALHLRHLTKRNWWLCVRLSLPAYILSEAITLKDVGERRRAYSKAARAIMDWCV